MRRQGLPPTDWLRESQTRRGLLPAAFKMEQKGRCWAGGGKCPDTESPGGPKPCVNVGPSPCHVGGRGADQRSAGQANKDRRPRDAGQEAGSRTAENAHQHLPRHQAGVDMKASSQELPSRGDMGEHKGSHTETPPCL